MTRFGKAAIVMIVTAAAVGAIAGVSVYSSMQPGEIKAMSAQEVDDYLNARGMGFAKAAELNHYPGPRHVLDLSKELELTEEQTRKTQALFDAMKAQAAPLGKQLVDKERELDGMFAGGKADATAVERVVNEIGALRAKIRFAHLATHIEQKALLTHHQVMKYDELRGNNSPNKKEHGH